jgi:hypothetical protein
MSRLFANDGSLAFACTGSYGANGVTMGAFVKVTNHPIAAKVVMAFGVTSASNDESHLLRCTTTDDQWQLTSTITGGTSSSAVLSFTPDAAVIGTTYNAATGWFGLLAAIAIGDDFRELNVANTAVPGTNAVTRLIANTLKFVRIGENFLNAGDWVGRIAEPVIWDGLLTAQQKSDYLSGALAASSIGAPIMYCSLATSSLANTGSDATAALTTVAGPPAFDADHPIIGSVPSGILVPTVGPFGQYFKGPFA